MTGPPPLDTRLVRALSAVTPDVDDRAVLHEIARRRHARAQRRRARRVLGVSSLVAAGAAVVFAIGADRSEDVRTIGPADGQPGHVTTTTLGAPAGETVQVPGRGDRLVALAADETGFWVSRGGTSGSGGESWPDTITRFSLDGTVVASTELQGAANIAALDDRDLWVVVTEPRDGTAPPPLRLKQIDRDDGRLAASHALPLAEDPIGITTSEAGISVRGATTSVTVGRDGTVVAGPQAVGGDEPTTDAVDLAAIPGDRVWVIVPGGDGPDELRSIPRR